MPSALPPRHGDPLNRDRSFSPPRESESPQRGFSSGNRSDYHRESHRDSWNERNSRNDHRSRSRSRSPRRRSGGGGQGGGSGGGRSRRDKRRSRSESLQRAGNRRRDDHDDRDRKRKDRSEHGGSGRGSKLPQEKCVCIEVGQENVGYMVGKGGETIGRMKSESKAYMGFEPPLNPGDPCRLLIRGTTEQVATAENLALVLLEDAKNRGRTIRGGAANGPITEVLTIDQEMVSRIIGSRGEKINKIRDEAGASVELDESTHQPKLIINGSQEACDKAKNLIQETIENSKKVDTKYD